MQRPFMGARAGREMLTAQWTFREEIGNAKFRRDIDGLRYPMASHHLEQRHTTRAGTTGGNAFAHGLLFSAAKSPGVVSVSCGSGILADRSAHAFHRERLRESL